MAIIIIKGNKNDLSCVDTLSLGLQRKLLGDKGHISKELFNRL